MLWPRSLLLSCLAPSLAAAAAHASELNESPMHSLSSGLRAPLQARDAIVRTPATLDSTSSDSDVRPLIYGRSLDSSLLGLDLSADSDSISADSSTADTGNSASSSDNGKPTDAVKKAEENRRQKTHRGPHALKRRALERRWAEDEVEALARTHFRRQLVGRKSRSKSGKQTETKTDDSTDNGAEN